MEAAGALEAVAAATGGAMFTVVTNADRALARIESELSGSYLLAIESAAGDRDGRPHALDVDVGRPGVTLRAGRYLPSGVEQSRPAGSAESIAAALASPIARSGLRLRVATESSQDSDRQRCDC